MADFKACVTFYNRRTTVKQKESMSHTVLTINNPTLFQEPVHSMLETYAFPLTSVKSYVSLCSNIAYMCIPSQILCSI